MRKIETACIIDDDPIFVFGARRIMEMAKFCKSFLIYGNGKEALEQLKPRIIANENLPELILLDINMPVMDGWQFLEEITKLPPRDTITIYIVTSSIDPADTKRANEYTNLKGYIVKPITIDRLKNMLEDF